MNASREISTCIALFPFLYALFLKHRLVEKLDVHIIADAFYMSVLTRPEYVARSPDFKVAQGILTRAEFREIPYRAQTLFGYSESTSLSVGEVRVRAPCRPSDVSAEADES